MRRGLDGNDRGSATMTGVYGAVGLTRRPGDAEEKQEIQNLRPQRKRRDVGWRYRLCSPVEAVDTQSQDRIVTDTALRMPRISADSVISGFDFLRASPRLIDCPLSFGLTGTRKEPR